jgi:hypothetical protein
MWLTRRIYDDLRDKLVAAEAEARGQAGALRTVQANFDFMRVRLNQLEQERAILIERMFGVKVPVPQIEKAPTPFDENKFNETFSFDGLDDSTAAALGISHDSEGRLLFTR